MKSSLVLGILLLVTIAGHLPHVSVASPVDLDNPGENLETTTTVPLNILLDNEKSRQGVNLDVDLTTTASSLETFIEDVAGTTPSSSVTDAGSLRNEETESKTEFEPATASTLVPLTLDEIQSDSKSESGESTTTTNSASPVFSSVVDETSTDTVKLEKIETTTTFPAEEVETTTTTRAKMSNLSRSDSSRVRQSVDRKSENSKNPEEEKLVTTPSTPVVHSNKSSSVTSSPRPPLTSNSSRCQEEVAKELTDIWNYSQGLGDHSSSDKELKTTLSSVVRLAYARLQTEPEDTLRRLKQLLQKLRERIGLPSPEVSPEVKSRELTSRAKRSYGIGEYEIVPLNSHENSLYSSYFNYLHHNGQNNNKNGHKIKIPGSHLLNSHYSHPENLDSDSDTSGEILSTATPGDTTIQKVVLVQDMDTELPPLPSVTTPKATTTWQPIEFHHKNRFDYEHARLPLQKSTAPPTIFLPPLRIPMSSQSQPPLSSPPPPQKSKGSGNNKNKYKNKNSSGGGKIKPQIQIQTVQHNSSPYSQNSVASTGSSAEFFWSPLSVATNMKTTQPPPKIETTTTTTTTVPPPQPPPSIQQQQQERPDPVSVDQIATAIVQLLYPTVHLQNPLSQVQGQGQNQGQFQNPGVKPPQFTTSSTPLPIPEEMSESNENDNENENDSNEPAPSNIFTFPLHKDVFVNKLALLNKNQNQKNQQTKGQVKNPQKVGSTGTSGNFYHLTTTKPNFYPTYLQFHPLPVLQLPNGTIAALSSYPPLLQHLMNQQGQGQNQGQGQSQGQEDQKFPEMDSDPEEAEAELENETNFPGIYELTTLTPVDLTSNPHDNFGLTLQDSLDKLVKNKTHLLMDEEEYFTSPEKIQNHMMQMNQMLSQMSQMAMTPPVNPPFKDGGIMQLDSLVTMTPSTTTTLPPPPPVPMTTAAPVPVFAATSAAPAPAPAVSVVQTQTVKVPGTPVMQILEELTDSNIMAAPSAFINGTREGFVQFITTLGTLSFTTKMVMIFALSISILSIVLGVYSLGPPIIAVGILGIMIPISILLLLQDSSRNRVKNPQGKITADFQEELYYILKLVETAYDKYENHYI